MADRDIVLIGLPCEGMRKLGEHFNMRHLEHGAGRNVWNTLDGWRDIAPTSMRRSVEESFRGSENRKMLIVYPTPWGFLERRTEQVASEMELETKLETFASDTLGLWHTFYRALLGLYHEHESRCLLINGDRPFETSEVARLMEERFGLNLSLNRSPTANGARDNPAVHEEIWFQITNAIAPNCADLYRELESCAELIGRRRELELSGLAKTDALMTGVLRLLIRHARIEGILRRHGIDTNDVESALEDELSKSENSADNYALHAPPFERSRERGETGDRHIDSLKEENELYVLQVHQLQEELQHHLELTREAESARARLQQRIDHFSKLDRQKEWRLRELQQKLDWLSEPIARKIVRILFNRKKPPRVQDLIEKDVVEQQVKRIRSSGLFDEKWYLQTYPDVAAAGADPIEHYLQFGSAEGRNPSATFDSHWYTNTNNDVAKANINPLLHYILYGKDEGRQPVRMVP